MPRQTIGLLAASIWFSAFALSAPLLGANLRLEPVCKDLANPLFLTNDGKTERLYVLEQPGRVRLFESGQLRPEAILDITDRVKFGGECGLLGLALHPDFASNGRLFVNYTTKLPEGTHTIVSEFKVDLATMKADPKAEKLLLRFQQPWDNHNGGNLMFGPDRMLYISTGDGGSGGDPKNNSQQLGNPLGKLLRIDVNHGSPYAVPTDNPFVSHKEVVPEIWAYGLRNPWRFSFDRKTGACYVGDVGQNKFEEVDIVEKGKNYGWSAREAFQPFKPERGSGEMVDPIKAYGRDQGVSVTGGYVYRGKNLPNFEGMYIYGDYATGRIWGLRQEQGKLTFDEELIDTDLNISSFGEDVAGEIYICNHRGEILKIVPP